MSSWIEIYSKNRTTTLKYIQLFENYTSKKFPPVEFNGKKFEIRQDANDKSLFGITNDEGELECCAMGEEFDPVTFDMTLEQMLQFIDKGIEYFSKMKKITLEDVKKSDYSDFFIPEIDDDITVGKFYVLAKLACGKLNAKWNADNS